MAAKGRANAGQRRKPRGHTVDPKALRQLKEDIVDRELLQLAFRLEIFEALRKNRELNTPFIALEALGAFAGAKAAGRTEKDLQSCWPEEWGTETITVPLSLLLALRDGWNDYKFAPPGKSLGEALKIEGGGQGRPPMRERLKTIDRDRALANAVESRYFQIEGAPDSMSLEDVFSEVAEAHGLSVETVKKAHSLHKHAIRQKLDYFGILKGVKTSRS